MTLERETFVVDIDVTSEAPLGFEQRRDLFSARQRTMMQTITLCIALMTLVPAAITAIVGALDKVDKTKLWQTWDAIKWPVGASWLSLALSVLLALLFLGIGPRWVKGVAMNHPVTAIMNHTYWLALLAFAAALGFIGFAFYRVLY